MPTQLRIAFVLWDEISIHPRQGPDVGSCRRRGVRMQYLPADCRIHFFNVTCQFSTTVKGTEALCPTGTPTRKRLPSAVTSPPMKPSGDWNRGLGGPASNTGLALISTDISFSVGSYIEQLFAIPEPSGVVSSTLRNQPLACGIPRSLSGARERELPFAIGFDPHVVSQDRTQTIEVPCFMGRGNPPPVAVIAMLQQLQFRDEPTA
jgi:hypothetical protein